MSIFNHYAKYYDLLYRDKDYVAEAAYVTGLLADYGVNGGTMLELGSGTGKHAFEFSHAGFSVDGYDISPSMVDVANQQAHETKAPISFQIGDVRTLRTGKKYDAVVSLFHVASYQTENDSLLAMFKTASEHLKSGGVFIFDCWYGPGVLTELPAVRIKRLEDETCEILRIAEPVMHSDRNVVDVNFTVMVSEKENGSQVTLKETHPMRYLFEPEVQILLDQAGLTPSKCLHWLTRNTAHIGSWQSVFIARSK